MRKDCEDQSSKGPIQMSHNVCHSRMRSYKRCHVRWSYMEEDGLEGIAFLHQYMENYIPQRSPELIHHLLTTNTYAGQNASEMLIHNATYKNGRRLSLKLIVLCGYEFLKTYGFWGISTTICVAIRSIYLWMLCIEKHHFVQFLLFRFGSRFLRLVM